MPSAFAVLRLITRMNFLAVRRVLPFRRHLHRPHRHRDDIQGDTRGYKTFLNGALVSISEKLPYGPATLTALGRRFGKGSPVWRRDPKRRD
jgi:hypothetical protein